MNNLTFKHLLELLSKYSIKDFKNFNINIIPKDDLDIILPFINDSKYVESYRSGYLVCRVYFNEYFKRYFSVEFVDITDYVDTDYYSCNECFPKQEIVMNYWYPFDIMGRL